jgi:hypothetical protein
LSEGPETIELAIQIIPTGGLRGVVPGSQNTTTIVIADDDFIEYRFIMTGYSFYEGNTSAVCVMTILPENVTFVPGGYVTLEFSTTPLTANDTSDYVQTVDPMMLTLTETEIVSCTSVTALTDQLVEGMEYFELFFEPIDLIGSFVVDGSNTTLITILDANSKPTFALLAFSVCLGTMSGIWSFFSLSLSLTL